MKDTGNYSEAFNVDVELLISLKLDLTREINILKRITLNDFYI